MNDLSQVGIAFKSRTKGARDKQPRKRRGTGASSRQVEKLNWLEDIGGGAYRSLARVPRGVYKIERVLGGEHEVHYEPNRDGALVQPRNFVGSSRNANVARSIATRHFNRQQK